MELKDLEKEKTAGEAATISDRGQTKTPGVTTQV